MDARTIRTLMDIQALQSFGTVQDFTEPSNSSSNIFSTMLGDMLGNSSISESVASTSMSLLGSALHSENLLYYGNNPVFRPLSLETSLPKKPSFSLGMTSQNVSRDHPFAEIIKEVAGKYNLPEKLISSVIKQESNFNNNVVSRAGAEGLMQLMPGTAKFLGVTDSFDPVQNITGGAKYLRQMLNQFNGNTELALAAYNAGPGNVKKYGGIPPFQETQQYVQKVLGYFNS